MFESTTGLRAGELTRQPSSDGYWEDGWWVDTTPDPWTRAPGRSGSIPCDLDSIEPGILLAAVISSVDRSTLSGNDLVTLLRAEDRLISHFQAGRYESMSEIATLVVDPDAASTEVGVALRMTRAAADAEHALADCLARHVQVRDALRKGDVDLRRARVLLDACVGLTQDVVDSIVARVLPSASELTTGQIRARVQRLRMEFDAATAVAALKAGLEDRRVVAEANPDGTANLIGFNMAPDRVMAARRRLDQLARQAKTPGDLRTADQRRADVFLDLLLGPDTGNATGSVDIAVDLETLVGLSEAPGHIPGWGPVIADIARKVVNEQITGQWTFTATDQGRPVATGTVSRRPTESMKRHLRARYRTCVFPGCRMPARQSDLDHGHPWASGGKTMIGNQAPLCRFHHQVKDKGWSYRIEFDGAITWTSPLGHTYVTGADPPA